MPYKSENIPLRGLQDRRRKLTDEDRETIRNLYAEGKGSLKALADMFGVSKSTVGIIVNPAWAERVRQRNREHWRDYVDREKLTASVRNLRRYKQELYLKGELTDEEK